MAESKRCLQCTCEAIGYCDLRRQGIEYGTTLTTLEPQTTGAGYRSVTENRFTGTNHDYIRDDSHAFILREPSRCIDCGRCANVCKEVVGAACYDFMRTGFDTLVTTPLDMSLNTTPCVSCGRCAETCPTGALMPKPRVLEKYEVDESRCILCGICVDACPYDALRCGPDFELAHESRERADDRPDGHQRRSTATPRSPRSSASATGWSGPADGRTLRATGADAADAAGQPGASPPTATGTTATATGTGTGTVTGTAVRRPWVRATRAVARAAPAPSRGSRPMRAWLYLIAAAIAGAIITTPGILVFLIGGGSCDDVLFASLGTLMIVSGLVVVTCATSSAPAWP